MPRLRRAGLSTPGVNMNKILTPAMSTHQDHYVLELSEIDTRTSTSPTRTPPALERYMSVTGVGW
eukprot:12891383-Prorocentrum_lima.AAC.1